MKKLLIILLILSGCSGVQTTKTMINPSAKPVEHLDAQLDGRCVAITLKGERCKRDANPKDSLCWQHREIQDRKK